MQQTAAGLVQQGYYGYQGWGDAAANADFAATKGAGKGGPTNNPQPTIAPAQPVQTAQPTSQPQSAPAAGGANTAQGLVAQGYYGYQGWGDAEAAADFKATGGQGKGGPIGSSSAGGVGLNGTPTLGGAPTIDLNAITTAAYNTPEIQAAEKAVTDRQQALATASAGINDNPFYSEATRVGKQSQLTTEANNDIQVQQEKLASLKADAAIKVNAATGQYNIDNARYQQTLSTFNSLVSAGALADANPTDLANYAAATGIPVSALQSIQKASQAKNNPVSIVQSTDNNGNLSLIGVDSQGKVVTQTTIPGVGATKTTKNTIEDKNATTNQLSDYLAQDAKNGADLKSIVDRYGVAGGLNIDEIYRIYNENSKYGAAKETIAQVKQGQFADTKSSTPAKKAFNLLDPSTW